jgi:hypothetical protein
MKIISADVCAGGLRRKSLVQARLLKSKSTKGRLLVSGNRAYNIPQPPQLQTFAAAAAAAAGRFLFTRPGVGTAQKEAKKLEAAPNRRK